MDLELGRGYEVVAILVGRRGWLSGLRLRQLARGHDDQRIAWRRVARLAGGAVQLRDG